MIGFGVRQNGTMAAESIDEVLILRRAHQRDADLLRMWRNDPVTLQNSRRQAPMSWDTYWNEFTGYLADPSCVVLIAELHGIPVGTVRFDDHGHHREISYTVAPQSRGRGYAKQMVAMACSSLRDRAIRAEIRAGNIASIGVIQACGFIRDGSRDDYALWRLDPQ
jgi:RimJ/RimL family protein N-acetyltransferase